MSLPDFSAFPLYLAPMAGVTDPIFRTLCKEEGADVMVTEFVSAEGVLQAWSRNRRYVEFEDAHRPLGIQIFGSVPEHCAAAARIIVDAMQPDFLDINAGCPVPKVVGKNGGSSLLKDLPLLQRMAAAVVQELGSDCPVTTKIRIGWEQEHICAPEAVRRLEDAGVQAVAIHGRTRSQQYGGKADWEMIDRCARLVSIPVIGNGDICTLQQAQHWLTHVSPAGIMIGRGAVRNPYIFRQIRGGPAPPAEELQQYYAILAEETDRILHTKRTPAGHCNRMKKYLAYCYPDFTPEQEYALRRCTQISDMLRILCP